MTKQYFRDCFAECNKYVKFSVICKETGVPQSAFSYFMKGSDRQLSLESLQKIYDRLQEVKQRIA